MRSLQLIIKDNEDATLLEYYNAIRRGDQVVAESLIEAHKELFARRADEVRWKVEAIAEGRA